VVPTLGCRPEHTWPQSQLSPLPSTDSSQHVNFTASVNHEALGKHDTLFRSSKVAPIIAS
jgi:hypothetical protein